MPRLRFSRVVWLVLLSQVLSLAVVANVLWDFQNGLSQLTDGLDQAASQPPPDTLTGPTSGGSDRQRPALGSPRIIGETNLVLECITNAFQVSRREYNRGEAIRQEVAREKAAREKAARRDDNPEEADWDTAIGNRIDCDKPGENKESGQEDSPPGKK